MNSQDPEYKNLSKRAKQLLAREEGFDVDFKRSLSGLEAEDIVAFANSKAGGAILIGIDESKSSIGRQVGTVVGCSVGDPEKRKILDKAHQSVPPINVTVHVENRSNKPFYRVEIPSGPNKPYCTSGGTYKIRGDGRKNTLFPTPLLNLFLETEGGEFLRRFQQATSALQDSVENVRQKVASDLGDLAGSVAEMEFKIDQSLERVVGTAESAEENATNANAFAEQTLHLVEQVYALIEKFAVDDPILSHKLDALLKHFSIEDPKLTEQRQFVKALVGGIRNRLDKLGKRTNRRTVANVAKKALKTPGKAVWNPTWIDDAINDLDGSKQAFSQSSGLENLGILLSIDNLLPLRNSKTAPRQNKNNKARR